MSNYAYINLVNELARVPGVGSVTVHGVGQYAMRVWLDPEKLYARSLTPNDIIESIRQQSKPVSAGQVGAPPAPKSQDFRLKDVGRVELGAQSYSQYFRLNGRPSTGIAIYQSPEANAFDVAGRVEAKMAELARALGAGV